jgi:hypothetical protein
MLASPAQNDYKQVTNLSPVQSPLSIVIATRESRLALWQAEHVQALLRARGHTVRCWA